MAICPLASQLPYRLSLVGEGKGNAQTVEKNTRKGIILGKNYALPGPRSVKTVTRWATLQAFVSRERRTSLLQ